MGWGSGYTKYNPTKIEKKEIKKKRGELYLNME
jgi:hypothetical protein